MKHATIADAFSATLGAAENIAGGFIDYKRRRNEQETEKFNYELQQEQNRFLQDIESGKIANEDMDREWQTRVEGMVKAGVGSWKDHITVNSRGQFVGENQELTSALNRTAGASNQDFSHKVNMAQIRGMQAEEKANDDILRANDVATLNLQARYASAEDFAVQGFQYYEKQMDYLKSEREHGVIKEEDYATQVDLTNRQVVTSILTARADALAGQGLSKEEFEAQLWKGMTSYEGEDGIYHGGAVLGRMGDGVTEKYTQYAKDEAKRLGAVWDKAHAEAEQKTKDGYNKEYLEYQKLVTAYKDGKATVEEVNQAADNINAKTDGLSEFNASSGLKSDMYIGHIQEPKKSAGSGGGKAPTTADFFGHMAKLNGLDVFVDQYLAGDLGAGNVDTLTETFLNYSIGTYESENGVAVPEDVKGEAKGFFSAHTNQKILDAFKTRARGNAELSSIIGSLESISKANAEAGQKGTLSEDERMANARQEASYMAFLTDMYKEKDFGEKYRTPGEITAAWERFQGKTFVDNLMALKTGGFTVAGRNKNLYNSLAALEDNPDAVISVDGNIHTANDQVNGKIETINQDAMTALGRELGLDVDALGKNGQVTSFFEIDEKDKKDVKSVKNMKLNLPTDTNDEELNERNRALNGIYRIRADRKSGTLVYEKQDSKGRWSQTTPFKGSGGGAGSTAGAAPAGAPGASAVGQGRGW